MKKPHRRIAIVNRKGGSGKSTTAVNLSAALAIRGERTLLVDMDPQSSASIHLGVTSPEITIYEALLGMEPDVTKAIVHTKVDRLDIIPSAPRLAGAELELADVPGRELLLKNILATVAQRYNFIIVDCPVSLGVLTVNALVACDEALAPVQTHYLSVIAVEQLREVVRLINERLNPELQLIGLVPAMVDRRMKISAELVADMEKEYGRNIVRPSIRLDAKLAEAPSKGKPIQLYAPKSNGAYDYTILADDIRVM